MQGTVSDFDEHVGLGHVRVSETGEEFLFHCTQIADGTRTIEVGIPVKFTTRQVITGTTEAFEIIPT